MQTLKTVLGNIANGFFQGIAYLIVVILGVGAVAIGVGLIVLAIQAIWSAILA